MAKRNGNGSGNSSANSSANSSEGHNGNGRNGKRQNNQLTKAQQIFICQGHAEFKTSAQIMAELNRTYKIKITSTGTIDYYKYNDPWKALILEKRQVWLQEIENELPLSHRKIRIMRLQELYEEAIQEKLVRVIHWRGDVIAEVYEKDIGNAIKCLESIREEMKPFSGLIKDEDEKRQMNFNTSQGDINIISGDYIARLDNMTDEELKEREASVESWLRKYNDRINLS